MTLEEHVEHQLRYVPEVIKPLAKAAYFAGVGAALKEIGEAGSPEAIAEVYREYEQLMDEMRQTVCGLIQ